jgi:hypothetical protein
MPQGELRASRNNAALVITTWKGMWWLPMGKGKGKGVNSETLKPIWKKIHAKAKALGITKPVLNYDRAAVHKSKATQAELGRVFGTGNHEQQAAKSQDTNNGDAGVFPNAARATAYSGAANKDEVMAVVAKWFKTVDTKMLEAFDDRVLRNYERILERSGGYF